MKLVIDRRNILDGGSLFVVFNSVNVRVLVSMYVHKNTARCE
jgi:hypothetical protein